MMNNKELRSLFVLPPVQTSTSTALATVETPAPKNETGDREIDAVLWLQDCVRTGEEALSPMPIDRAKAVAEVATVLVNSAKVEVDYLKVTKQSNGSIFGGAPALENKQ